LYCEAAIDIFNLKKNFLIIVKSCFRKQYGFIYEKIIFNIKKKIVKISSGKNVQIGLDFGWGQFDSVAAKG